jgi:hypothetical protein
MRLRQNGTVFLMIKLAASMAGPGLNSKQIERRTSNVQHRTSNIDDATLYLILKQANRSLQRAPRQAQGLSTSKAAESNFEGKLRSCSAGACAGCCSVLLIKLTEFIIRCWTFNVRCSTFISFFFDLTGLFLAGGGAEP